MNRRRTLSAEGINTKRRLIVWDLVQMSGVPGAPRRCQEAGRDRQGPGHEGPCMLTMLGARTTSKKHLQGIWLSNPSLYPKASVLKGLIGHFLHTVAALKPQP